MIDETQDVIIEDYLTGNMSHHFKTRMRRTKKLLEHVPEDSIILDLGPSNAMSMQMKDWGYDVHNTGRNDLDEHYDMLSEDKSDVCTAFEILEHLRNPYMVLKSLQTPILVLSVPLNVWFSTPYWNKDDPWDTHFHEFYPKQLRSLLDKTGWEIYIQQFWNWDSAPLRPRPILRKIGPWASWMAVIAMRK